MINVSDRFHQLAAAPVRPLDWDIGISFTKQRNANVDWFTLDQSTLDGGDLIASDTTNPIQLWDSYDYLFLNDLYNQMQTLTNDGYDVLSLQPNDIGLEEMWFDVKIPLSHLNKSFDSNKKQ